MSATNGTAAGLGFVNGQGRSLVLPIRSAGIRTSTFPSSPNQPCPVVTVYWESGCGIETQVSILYSYRKKSIDDQLQLYTTRFPPQGHPPDNDTMELIKRAEHNSQLSLVSFIGGLTIDEIPFHFIHLVRKAPAYYIPDGSKGERKFSPVVFLEMR
uniref:Uncharacterized protein n=1 Tax=Timema genevievae TaxID=629358 RepID=A0A7R9PLM0_TIMGE|nr:unnamed protein product [Timema genevievae]